MKLTINCRICYVLVGEISEKYVLLFPGRHISLYVFLIDQIVVMPPLNEIPILEFLLIKLFG